MQLFDKNGNDVTASFLYQPNLLDNADFRNFINQRKKTTYIGIASNRVYTGDRWSIYGEGQTVNIKDTYVEFINDSAPGNLLQYLEFPLIEREIYTISANINGNIVKKNITGGTYDTNENLMYGSNGTYEYIAIHTDIGATNKLYWCKLEPGSIATPFVPRPYAEELLLCQRYYLIMVETCMIITRQRFDSNISYYPGFVLPNEVRTVGTATYESRTPDGIVLTGELQAIIDRGCVNYFNIWGDYPNVEITKFVIDAEIY